MKRNDLSSDGAREIVMPKRFSIREAAPHIRVGNTVTGMSIDVLLALLPVTVWSAILFGWHTLWVLLLSVISAMLTEFVAGLIFCRTYAVLDGTAVVTGWMLALLLPPEAPVWLGALGSAFAIFFVKQCFGGLGCNVFNPAIAGRLFLSILFPAETAWTAALPAVVLEAKSPLSLLFGVGGGPIADASALLLVAGGLFLVCRHQIAWEGTASFLMITLLGALLIPAPEGVLVQIALTLCSGGTFLAAFFLLTDPVTAPMTGKGRVIYGAAAAVLLLVFRVWLDYADGVLLAILLVNLLIWPAERFLSRAPQAKGERHA